jgi:hypothetical protein
VLARLDATAGLLRPEGPGEGRARDLGGGASGGLDSGDETDEGKADGDGEEGARIGESGRGTWAGSTDGACKPQQECSEQGCVSLSLSLNHT